MSQQKPLQYVVKDLQPEYITVEDDTSGPHGFSDDPRFALRQDFIDKVKGVPAVRGWWRCPYCMMDFPARRSCEKHMGLVANSPAYCGVLLDEDEERRSQGRVTIKLTRQEYKEAMQCAAKRTARAKTFHRTGQNKQPVSKKALHDKSGCLGERAYCKWKGLPLSAMDHYARDLRAETHGQKPADFGRVDVKAKQKKGRFMLVQLNDPVEHIYVLASCDIGDHVVDLCGWEEGRVVMDEKHWGDPRHTERPCYWFPEELLRPMHELTD